MRFQAESKLQTFEQATAFVQKIGILPLSSFIPDYPSLESETTPSQWHTGLDTDPWLWRDRFAGEGLAAYGRFFAKKPLLISAELFPLVKNILDDPYTVGDRYEDGTVSKATVDVYQAIANQEGIDVRLLRSNTGLSSKESKSEFDRALIELQSTADIVITGISDRLGANGVKSGWNSTCYMTAEHWMELHGMEKNELPSPEAKVRLRQLLQERCEAKSLAFFYKVFGL
jgi:hypothetical protein